MSSPLLVIKTKGDKQMKKVGTCYYVHKSNKKQLMEIQVDSSKLADIMVAISEVERIDDFKYEVIKYDKQKHQVTFIDSPDWVTANEPEVGDAWMLKMQQDWTWKFIKKRSKNPQIYHGKWRFVDQSFYKDFDVIKSYEREKTWQQLPGIKEVKKFIGNKDFWVEFLHKNGMEV